MNRRSSWPAWRPWPSDSRYCESADAFEQLRARFRAAPGFRLVDVTSAAGIHFQHNSGAYGGKLLPETLGSGCAFLDYDGDGWQDILLINGMDWPDHKQAPTTPCASIATIATERLPTSPNAPASTSKCTAWVSPSAITTTTAFPTFWSPASAKTACSKTPAKAPSSTSPAPAVSLAVWRFSTSALWFDYDRDGLLDLFVCNYVKWSRGA